MGDSDKANVVGGLATVAFATSIFMGSWVFFGIGVGLLLVAALMS